MAEYYRENPEVIALFLVGSVAGRRQLEPGFAGEICACAALKSSAIRRFCLAWPDAVGLAPVKDGKP